LLFRLILLFVGLPLLELMILIQLGRWIGLWPTLALVLVTGVVGAALAKAQGLRAWLRIRSELASGRVPMGDLLDGLMILIGGVVLLTPGLLSDLFGLALLVPGPRHAFKRYLRRRFERAVQLGDMRLMRIGERWHD
jgi:UPF0716 protein FxsA